MNSSDLKTHIRKIILDVNPVGAYIIEDENTNEYDPEIELILKDICKCHTKQQLFDLFITVFDLQFGENVNVTRHKEFIVISDKVWELIKP